MSADSDLARISRIGDSVFAVTITLLAYRVRIPATEVLASGKLSALAPFLSDLGAVVMSFFVTSIFWISHWRMLRRMHRSDLTFAALNLVFLGALVLLPICTSLISGGLTTIGTFAYSADLLLASIAGFFLRRHARRLEPQAFAGRPLLSTTLAMVVFGTACAISLVSPVGSASLWWLAIGIPWIDRRWGLGPSA